MASSEDDVVVRLRLKDVKSFIADVKAGKLAIEDLEKQVKKTGQTAEKVSANGTGGLSKLANHFQTLGYWAARGVGAIAVAGVGVAGYAIKSASDLEQVSIAYKTLMGSASAAQAKIAEIRKFAIDTPFRLPDVEEAGKLLLAYKFNAASLIPTLTAAGDAASALSLGSEGLKGIVNVLGQMKSAQVVHGQDMLQLSSRGIMAKEMLEQAFHLTPQQYNKAEQAGKISAAAAIPVILRGMEKQFHNSMAAQSKTLGGIASNFMDGIQGALTDAVNPFLPTLEKWLTGAVNFISDPGHQAALSNALAHVGAWLSRASDVIPFLRTGDDYGASNIIARLFGDKDGKTAPTIEHLIGLVRNLGTIFAQDMVPAMKDFSVVLGLVGPLLAGLDGVTGFMADHSTAFHVALDLVVGSLVAYRGAVLVMNGAIGAYNLVTSWAELKTTGFTKATNLQRLALVAWRVVVWTATAAQWAWNAAVEAGWLALLGPIGLVIAAIAILVAGVIWAYKNVGWFRDGVNWAWEKLKDFGGWIKNNWSDTVAFMLDPLQRVLDTWHDLQEAWKWFTGQGAGAGPAGPPTNKPADPERARSYSGTIVPFAATGGTITRSGATWVGERGPELLNLPRGAQVIPLPRGGAGMGQPLHVHVEVNGREIATAVLDDLNARAARR